jgi:ABC-type Fe3+ transport system permease subunit
MTRSVFRRTLGSALLALGLCLIGAWFAISVYWFVKVIKLGCLSASLVDYPPDLDCGDVRRGAFFVSVWFGLLTFPFAALLALPYWIGRRRREREYRLERDRASEV